MVNKAEVDVFLELACFLMMQWILAIWCLVPLPFLKPAWTSGSSQLTYCWSLAWRILSITLLVCEMSASVQSFEHSLALPFFGIGMKTDLFQACGHCWVFQIFWPIECSTFRASSFRIRNRLSSFQPCFKAGSQCFPNAASWTQAMYHGLQNLYCLGMKKGKQLPSTGFRFLPTHTGYFQSFPHPGLDPCAFMTCISLVGLRSQNTTSWAEWNKRNWLQASSGGEK